MKKQLSTRKIGTEQVKVSMSVDSGKTTVEISVYAQAGRTNRKGQAVATDGEVT